MHIYNPCKIGGFEFYEIIKLNRFILFLFLLVLGTTIYLISKHPCMDSIGVNNLDTNVLSLKWIPNHWWKGSPTQVAFHSDVAVQKIQDVSRKMELFQCKHVYREANVTAELLAKWSHKHDLIEKINSTHQLYWEIRGSYILEKMEMQTFTRRLRRRIKQPP